MTQEHCQGTYFCSKGNRPEIAYEHTYLWHWSQILAGLATRNQTHTWELQSWKIIEKPTAFKVLQITSKACTILLLSDIQITLQNLPESSRISPLYQLTAIQGNIYGIFKSGFKSQEKTIFKNIHKKILESQFRNIFIFLLNRWFKKIAYRCLGKTIVHGSYI